MHSAGRTKASVGPKGPYGARLSLQVRSDPPDEFGGSYESECRPGGPYGALKLVMQDEFASGQVDDRDDGLELLVGHHGVKHHVHPEVLVA